MLFPNTQEAASTVLQGWSLGGVGRGSDTRQVDRSLPISCSQLFHLSGKPSVKCNAQPLGVIGYEYPVKSRW